MNHLLRLHLLPLLLILAAVAPACTDDVPEIEREANNDVNNDVNNDADAGDAGDDPNNDAPDADEPDANDDEPDPQPVCEAEAVRCADARTLERCSDPLAGFAAEPCPEGQFCFDDQCQDPICQLGEVICLNPTALQRCEEFEGIPTPQTQNCAQNEVCDAGQCQARVCDPQAPPRCLDQQTAVFCDPPGLTERQETCFQGQICLDQGCQTQLCNPGVRLCRGESIDICNELGTAYEDGGSCGDGTTCFEGECLNPCQLAERQRSYVGCAYTALDLPNSSRNQQNGFGISVANPSQTETATVTIETRNEVVATLSIPPLSVVSHIDEVRSRKLEGTGIFPFVFRVTSDLPVVAYQFNSYRTIRAASTDGSLLFPDHALFNQYLAMTYSGDNLGAGSEPYVAISAIEPDTEVTVTPTTATQASIPGSLSVVPALEANQAHTITLQPFEVLVLSGLPGVTDLTGSQIFANRPVAVFGGNFATQVPTGRVFRDHLEQQLFPRQALGDRYVVARSRRRGVNPLFPVLDQLRIMADLDGTVVSFNPPIHDPINLDAGQWAEIGIDDHVEIISTAPVLVGQFFAGSGGNDTNQEGDPTFIMQVPTAQFRNDYVFICPPTYTHDYVSITAPPTANIVLDGVALDLSQETIGDSGLGVTIIELDDDEHVLTGDQPFGVQVYGFGGPPAEDPNGVQNVSYGYPAGLNLNEINPKE